MFKNDSIHYVEDVQNMAGGSVDGLNDSIHYVEYIKIISDHPVVNTFITGGGSVSYGTLTYIYIIYRIILLVTLWSFL